MSKTSYQLQLNYKGSNQGIPNLQYSLHYFSTMFPTLGNWIEQRKLTDASGKTPKFYPKTDEGNLTLIVYHSAFTKPIKRVIKINSAAVRQGQLPGMDQIPYIIKVDVGIYAPFHVIAEEVGKRQEAERHKTQYHQIRSGETLDGIAKYYKRDISLLMKNNNITNKNDIKAGTKLYVGEALLHKDLKCKAPLIESNLRRNLGKWST